MAALATFAIVSCIPLIVERMSVVWSGRSAVVLLFNIRWKT